jgi:hypothetical protein
MNTYWQVLCSSMTREFFTLEETLDGAFYPHRERGDVAIEFLLLGRVQIPVVSKRY